VACELVFWLAWARWHFLYLLAYPCSIGAICSLLSDK
jgi:hypothetical protein